MKKRISTLLITCLLSVNANADLTGAGDAAILTQLVEMTKNTVQQLETLKETLDAQKILTEMEQLKGVKELSDAGSDLGEIFGNIEKGANTFNDIKSDPFGLDKIESEISYVQRKIEQAEDKDDLSSAKAWTDVLKGLKRIKFLGQANESNLIKLQKGTSQNDLDKIGAESALISATAEATRLQREERQEAYNAELLQTLMNGYDYSVKVK